MGGLLIRGGGLLLRLMDRSEGGGERGQKRREKEFLQKSR